MRKGLLGLFILVDIVLIGATAYYLVTYLQHPRMAPSPRVVNVSVPVSSTPVSTATVKSTNVAISVATAPGGETTTRKILFTYRNSHARDVAIRADFTGWKAEPMQKTASGAWTYQATLSPGEYAYCFTADDKTFKDPANKRTKQIGRTMVSAILVEPMGAKPK